MLVNLGQKQRDGTSTQSRGAIKRTSAATTQNLRKLAKLIPMPATALA
jgi:hypothetical protein